VGFGDLAAQHQTDSRAGGLRREEGNKQVARVRKTRPFVFDRYFDVSYAASPSNMHCASGFNRGINRVADKIDQELFQLITIRADRDLRSAVKIYSHSSLEADDSFNKRADVERLLLWLRKPSHSRIRIHESIQRFGSRSNDSQASLHVVLPIGGARLARDQSFKASRD